MVCPEWAWANIGWPSWYWCSWLQFLRATNFTKNLIVIYIMSTWVHFRQQHSPFRSILFCVKLIKVIHKINRFRNLCWWSASALNHLTFHQKNDHEATSNPLLMIRVNLCPTVLLPFQSINPFSMLSVHIPTILFVVRLEAFKIYDELF